MRRYFSEIHFHFPGLNSADVEEVIENAVEPVTVLAGCHQEFGLFRSQASYLLFQKQVDGHANGCERALQLVGNR